MVGRKGQVRLCCLGLFLAVFSCAQSEQTKGEVVAVDLMNASKPHVSDFFKSVDVIQLEGRDSAYLNVSCLSNYVISDNKLYVLDQANKSIVVFGTDGEFEERICRYGRGPGEYVMLTDFAVDTASHRIDVLEATGAIKSYDLKPPHSFIGCIQIPKDLHTVSNFIPDETGYYIFSGYGSPVLTHLDVSRGELMEIDGIPAVEQNRRRGYSVTGTPFYRAGGDVCYVDGASGAIFHLTGDGAEPYMSWNFGKYSFRQEYAGRHRESASYEILLDTSSSMAGPVAQIRETDRYIFANVLFNKQWTNVVLEKGTESKSVFTEFKEGGMFSPGYCYNNALYLLVPHELAGRFLPSDATLLEPDADSNYLILKYSL